MSLVWSGHRGHTGTHTVPRKTHQCPQTHPKHVSPAKEAALISRRGQIKPTSFYCNFYPSRISPSLQVQATETLIPIQMSLPGSSFIRKKKKNLSKHPKARLQNPGSKQCAQSQEERASPGLSCWKAEMRPCLPSSACSPLPATAFINSDYFSPVNCPVRVTGWEPRAGAWSSDLRGKRPSLPSSARSRWELRRRARLWLRPGMTEAFSQQPDEGRALVGEGREAEFADGLGGGVTLPTRQEFGPLQNASASKSRALKLQLWGLASDCLSG